jgi:hypothetical protein
MGCFFAIPAAAILLLMAWPNPSTAAKAGRSYDECQQLAIARGLKAQAKPNPRFHALNAQGQANKPTGFMAQCMTGKLKG